MWVWKLLDCPGSHIRFSSKSLLWNIKHASFTTLLWRNEQLSVEEKDRHWQVRNDRKLAENLECICKSTANINYKNRVQREPIRSWESISFPRTLLHFSAISVQYSWPRSLWIRLESLTRKIYSTRSKNEKWSYELLCSKSGNRKFNLNICLCKQRKN